MNNNIANALGGNTVNMSWHEVLTYKPETRTAEEIKTGILNKLHSIGD